MERNPINPYTIPSFLSTAYVLCHSTYCSPSFFHSRLCLTFSHIWPCLSSMGIQRGDLYGSKTNSPFPSCIYLSPLHHPAPHPLPSPNPPQVRVVSHLCPRYGNVVWNGLTSMKILWVMILAQYRTWPHLHSRPWSFQ
jgi:hypothetical protein